MKKNLVAIFFVALAVVDIASCNKGSAGDVKMQYIKADQLKANLGSSEYTVLDVRKVADYSAGHIDGAIGADMDAVKESGKVEDGKETMKQAINGLNNNLVLVCYSGKRYAQAATNVLSSLGYDMKKVYTLEGGMKAWAAASN